ncbi:MAG: TRAP transporter substrate-binding protein, partial [Desulfobacterales bacterium]|nr:TRAP transporter substrate-binding protein [Desulfobacterales bacterium]
VYQRADNRSKDADRLKLLKAKGMQVVEDPDVAAFRAKVVDLKDMDLYKDPKVQDMLLKIIEAVK